MGMTTASLRVAAVILAVAERPGRNPGGGLSSVTETVKSLASPWLVAVLRLLLVVVWPDVELTALIPISVTRPLNVLSGIASMLTSAGCPYLMPRMSVSSTFTTALITERLATWKRALPG